MDKRNIKALFFDIDGTLAGYETHRINETDHESLQKLKEKGILLFIATGRDLRIPREARITEMKQKAEALKGQEKQPEAKKEEGEPEAKNEGKQAVVPAAPGV